MALLMGAAMGAVMLPFVWGMYRNRALNVAILAWMRAMIPHHSIAILTSERAGISDPRVKDLAGRIIGAQRKEIEEMKALIVGIDGRSQACRPPA